jgi:ribose 1,5-bisphosphokinase PhnN
LGPLVRGLFQALNEQQVDYLVMRNYQGYPDQLHKPDIGLFIAGRHRRRLVAAIRQLCAEQGYICFQNVDRKSGIAVTAIRFAAGNDGSLHAPFLKIDARTYESFDLTRIQKAIRGFSYRVFLDDTKRRTIQRDGCSFFILDQPDEMIFLLKQWKRKQDPRYRQELVDALEDQVWNRWFCTAIGARGPIDAELYFAARYLNDYDVPLWNMVQQRWGAHTVWRAVVSHLRVAWARLAGLHFGWGPLVYFSGPDGCGKTTLVEATRNMLARHGVKHTCYYSLKRYLRFVTQRLAWLKGRGARRTAAGNETSGSCGSDEDFRQFRIEWEHGDRDTGTRAWRVRKYMALLVGVADIWIGYSMALLYRVRGHTVLVETSPYDVFVKYHMPEFARTERVLARLVPKPTLGFSIHVEAFRLANRKSELTRSEIDHYYRRMERVLERGGAERHFVTVDNNHSVAEAAAEICRHVFQASGESQLR